MTLIRLMITPSQVIIKMKTVDSQLTTTAMIVAVMTIPGRLAIKFIVCCKGLGLDVQRRLVALLVGILERCRSA
jgi:hypothetical protein